MTPVGYQVVQEEIAAIKVRSIADMAEAAKRGFVDVVMYTPGGARLGFYHLESNTWLPIGPISLVLPSIASLLITAVTSDTEVTVADASALRTGNIMRWWDSSAAAELGDVAIAEIDGNDLVLEDSIPGLAADDQAWRVSDMRPYTVGDTSRDFSPAANTGVIFPGTGIFAELLGAATLGSVLTPFNFSTEKTAIALFGQGLTIPDVADKAVILHAPDWDDLYAGVGEGVRAAGSSVYQAAHLRGGTLIAGVAGATPSTRRSIVMENHVGIMRGSAPPANQQAYSTAVAGGKDTDACRIEVQLRGSGVSALLTGLEVTASQES